jgi:hypothetical protein
MHRGVGTWLTPGHFPTSRENRISAPKRRPLGAQNVRYATGRLDATEPTDSGIPLTFEAVKREP